MIGKPKIETLAACPECGGQSGFFGSVGRNRMFRCRDCGHDFRAIIEARRTSDDRNTGDVACSGNGDAVPDPEDRTDP